MQATVPDLKPWKLDPQWNIFFFNSGPALPPVQSSIRAKRSYFPRLRSHFSVASPKWLSKSSMAWWHHTGTPSSSMMDLGHTAYLLAYIWYVPFLVCDIHHQSRQSYMTMSADFSLVPVLALRWRIWPRNIFLSSGAGLPDVDRHHHHWRTWAPCGTRAQAANPPGKNTSKRVKTLSTTWVKSHRPPKMARMSASSACLGTMAMDSQAPQLVPSSGVFLPAASQ